MTTTFFKHAVFSAAATTIFVLVAGGVASAHIDPDPIAVQSGTPATVAFKVEHGCDGSPTTGMKFQIPDGVTDAVGVVKEGWTSTVAGNTLEFTGGPLAADQEDHFDITFTAPATPGNISFPVIQTCEQGEAAWIDPVVEGTEEPEHPAPTLKVSEGPPTAEDLTPAPEAETTEGTVVATGTETAHETDDDDSNTGAIVAAVIVAALVLIGGGVLIARNRKATPPAPDSTI